MKIITVSSAHKLIKRHGIDEFFSDLIDSLRRDFSKWDTFTKMPRPAMHVPEITDPKDLYSVLE